MYISITDPTTGNRLYADLKIDETLRLHNGDLDSSIDRIDVRDVATETNLIEGILHELENVAVFDYAHFKRVLSELIGVRCDSCPELVEQVWTQHWG